MCLQRAIQNCVRKFGQALDLYCNKPNFIQQVCKLCIGNMKYDVQLVTALPALSPYIQYLELGRGFDDYDGMRPIIMKAVAKDGQIM